MSNQHWNFVTFLQSRPGTMSFYQKIQHIFHKRTNTNCTLVLVKYVSLFVYCTNNPFQRRIDTKWVFSCCDTIQLCVTVSCRCLDRIRQNDDQQRRGLRPFHVWPAPIDHRCLSVCLDLCLWLCRGVCLVDEHLHRQLVPHQHQATRPRHNLFHATFGVVVSHVSRVRHDTVAVVSQVWVQDTSSRQKIRMKRREPTDASSVETLRCVAGKHLQMRRCVSFQPQQRQDLVRPSWQWK